MTDFDLKRLTLILDASLRRSSGRFQQLRKSNGRDWSFNGRRSFFDAKFHTSNIIAWLYNLMTCLLNDDGWIFDIGAATLLGDSIRRQCSVTGDDAIKATLNARCRLHFVSRQATHHVSASSRRNTNIIASNIASRCFVDSPCCIYYHSLSTLSACRTTALISS